MEPFKNFAYIYDRLLGKYAHEDWLGYFGQLVERYQITYQRAADAACGTGSVAKFWADQKLEKIFATDYSESMLDVARKKNAGNRVRFWQQDLINFNIPEDVQLITCNFGSLNYLIRHKDLEQALAQFYIHLEQGGYLICDLHSIYYLKYRWGTMTHYLHDEDVYTVWVTSWDDQANQSTLMIDNFIKEPDGLFSHAHEIHLQKGYSLEEILGSLQKAGFKKIEPLDLVNLKPVRPETERFLLVAQK